MIFSAFNNFTVHGEDLKEYYEKYYDNLGLVYSMKKKEYAHAFCDILEPKGDELAKLIEMTDKILEKQEC